MVFMYPTSLFHCIHPFHPIVSQIPERGGHQTNNQQIKTLPQHNCTGCELVANLDCLDEGGSHGFIHCSCSSISSYSQVTQCTKQTPFVWMWQANAKTVITLLLSLCSASSGCSSGIPLLLLHVTIEGRPHSFARELRGDGLKITPLEMG